jgi:hypothetical protein
MIKFNNFFNNNLMQPPPQPLLRQYQQPPQQYFRVNPELLIQSVTAAKILQEQKEARSPGSTFGLGFVCLPYYQYKTSKTTLNC